ncbi:unnamed protein product, partial [Pleuronectes platessa]
ALPDLVITGTQGSSMPGVRSICKGGSLPEASVGVAAQEADSRQQSLLLYRLPWEDENVGNNVLTAQLPLRRLESPEGPGGARGAGLNLATQQSTHEVGLESPVRLGQTIAGETSMKKKEPFGINLLFLAAGTNLDALD